MHFIEFFSSQVRIKQHAKFHSLHIADLEQFHAEAISYKVKKP